MANSLTDAHHSTMKSKDSDTKNPEGSNEHIYMYIYMTKNK